MIVFWRAQGGFLGPPPQFFANRRGTTCTTFTTQQKLGSCVCVAEVGARCAVVARDTRGVASSSSSIMSSIPHTKWTAATLPLGSFQLAFKPAN